MILVRFAALLLTICLAGTAAADSVAFGSLQNVLEANHAASVEDLIAALPEPLRAHYVLVFASRSLQGASFANPRAILFGDDARLIVSFNGDPAQRGYSAIETMEFDPQTNGFVFREINFIGGKASISAPNPARCVACHGRPAHPIWDTPPTWPGSYGERYGAGLSAAEARGIRDFLALQPAHPRYRHLLGAARFAVRSTYVPDSRTVYSGESVESPNAALSALLATLNVRSILSQLSRARGFESHRYVLLAAAGGNCGPLEDFYPAADRTARAAALQDFALALGTADRVQTDAKSRRSQSGTSSRHGVSVLELTPLRFVVEKDLHLPTQHWTLALERGTYDLSAPDGAMTLEKALFEWVARTDAQLRDLSTFRSFSPDDAYCEHLRRQSQRTLAAEPPPSVVVSAMSEESETVRPEGHRPETLRLCIGCHAGGIGPALPFADEQELAGRLAAAGYPRGRLIDEILYRISAQAGSDSMPRGSNLSAADRRDLEDYFLKLASIDPSINRNQIYDSTQDHAK